MNFRLSFKKIVNIIVIPLLILSLSLYLPDVYHCQLLTEGTVEEFEASATCFTMVNNLQNVMWFCAIMFAIILLAFEFYKFKKSLSNQQQREGQ